MKWIEKKIHFVGKSILKGIYFMKSCRFSHKIKSKCMQAATRSSLLSADSGLVTML